MDYWRIPSMLSSLQFRKLKDLVSVLPSLDMFITCPYPPYWSKNTLIPAASNSQHVNTEPDCYILAPEEPEPWDDVFEADFLGSQCEQHPISLMMLTHPTWRDYDEDCLHLHIFTPAVSASNRHVVQISVFFVFNVGVKCYPTNEGLYRVCSE